ncbi:nucleoside hydrolase [Roseomonas elaeocarpi]|uniref:Nucleoside hydrolase n=1 Tax=Roseomonas elaeocarpi TaxID=907779 RepID=A0ABV6JVW0_9PROT
MCAKKVIFDTDPGIDDACALALIAASPALELIGITTVFGNASVETTTRNALYLRRRFGLAAPVARGAERPLSKPPRDFPTFIHGENGLGDVALEGLDSLGATHAKDAADFIVEQLRAAPGEVTLIAVGPLTNLALAIERAPEITALAAEVVVMGGAFGTAGRPGNVSPVAEANVWNDPDAADRVLTAPWPVRIVGLDVTTLCVMGPDYMAGLRDRAPGVGGFLWEITRFYEHLYRTRDGIDGINAHDALAVARAIEPALFRERRGPVRVVTDGIATGQTIQSVEGVRYPPGPWDGLPSQSVCVEADNAAFLKLYAEALVAWEAGR